MSYDDLKEYGNEASVKAVRFNILVSCLQSLSQRS